MGKYPQLWHATLSEVEQLCAVYDFIFRYPGSYASIDEPVEDAPSYVTARWRCDFCGAT